MKILQVIPSLGFGGAERLVLELSKHLTSAGHSVEIVIFHDDIAYEDLANDQSIRIISSRVFYSLFGKDVIMCDEFNKFVQDFKPDIIHSHLVEAELVSRQSTVKGCKYITHWHGCNPIADPLTFKDLFNVNRWRNLKQRKILEAQYVACQNNFICISEFIAGYLEKVFLKIERSRYHVIHNGVQLKTNSLGNKDQEDVERIELVTLGRLAPFKKQDLLLDVVHELVRRGHSNVRLNFIGDGHSRQALELKTQDLKIHEFVAFHGSQENPLPFLSSSDIMVHSTLNEAFGLAVVEGMSCSLPVVSFRTGGIPEIVEDSETGFLIEPENIMEFANAVEKLLLDKPLRMQMGLSARQKSKQFTMQAFCEKTEHLYFELQNSSE